MDAETDSKPSTQTQQVNRFNGLKLLAMLPLAILIRLWLLSLRFELTDSVKERLSNSSRPTIMLFWHNRVFLAPEIIRRYRKAKPTSALISASKDGAWLAALYRLLGIGTIRGSSSWRGLRAMNECVAALNGGCDIGITPDGPRGPVYTMKAGPIFIARKANAAVILASAKFHKAYRFKSWDRFYLPYPFSKVTVEARYFETIDAFACEDSDVEDLAVVKEALDEITIDD